ncbi:lytic transglycosylase domain-containing protein [Aromatoleum tolulyticum]|nr:lytic transglycosylase domain-containing protein [Aromatoleum tolulyticum]
MKRPTPSPNDPARLPQTADCARRSGTRANGRAGFVATALVMLCSNGPCWADRLYGYADDRGVFNFSDAPSDPRHRLILEIRPPRPVTGSTAARAAATSLRRSPGQLSPLIRDAARQNRLDPALVEAVAFVESRFDERARSPKGALGLMQLMPGTATRFGVSDPLDARQNLAGGARYLRELLDRFDSLPLAIAAYNAGEGAVERYGKSIPPYAETTSYVPKVLAHYSIIRNRPPGAGYGWNATELPPDTRARARCC